MWYMGERHGIHVVDFYKLVHEQLQLKYSIQENPTDINDAKTLQSFLRTLKYAKNHDVPKNIIGNFAVESAIDVLKLRNGRVRIFKETGKRQGKRFEEDLVDLVESVVGAVYKELYNNIPNFDIEIGDRHGNIDFEDKFLPSIQHLLQDLQVQTQKKVQNTDNTFSKLYYNASVQGKIDVKAAEVMLEIDPNNEFHRIASILNQSNISAKSYRSNYWDKEIKEILPSKHTTLSLSDSSSTNTYRAIHGVLSDLNYDTPTIISAYKAGLYKLNETQDHMYHIRFIYELAGNGIKYKGASYGNVRFLIYNDPASDDIFVKPVSQMIKEELEAVLSEKENWYKQIVYSKSNFS